MCCSYVFDTVSQEYPYHLTILKESRKMEQFLVNWNVFERLYNKEHSDKLLKYWTIVSIVDKLLKYWTK